MGRVKPKKAERKAAKEGRRIEATATVRMITREDLDNDAELQRLLASDGWQPIEFVNEEFEAAYNEAMRQHHHD